MKDFQKFTGQLRSSAIALAGPPSPAGVISGCALHFNETNQNGWAVASGAFDFNDERKPIMLWAHSEQDIIGRWTSVQVVGNSLQVKGELNLKIQRAKEALALLTAGDVSGLSVGLSVQQEDVERKGDGWLFKKAKLAEVSIVGYPADSEARISTVASGVTSFREYERFLRDAGFARSMAARLARAWPKEDVEQSQIQAAIERQNAWAAAIKSGKNEP